MKNRTSAAGPVILVLVAIIGGLTYKLLEKPPVNPAPLGQSPGPSANGGTVTSTPPPNMPVPAVPHGTVIYTVSTDGGGDDNGLAPQQVAGGGPFTARAALHALIRAANSPLPHGTELRGIKIADGLATVDFSREFASNFHGGDTQEAQAINSILLTLGQFPTIDRVQIWVEGKPIDALSQLPINAPLDVIRSQPVRQAQGGGAGG